MYPRLLLLVVMAGPMAAQTPDADVPRRVPPLPQWEVRAEGVAAEAPSAIAAVGVNLRAGWYTRLGASLGGGAQWRDGRPALGALRADATVRFHLDPFAEQRRGLYGGVGLSALHVGGGPTGGAGAQPPVLLLLAGVESRPRDGRVWAAEVGIGGGVRLAAVRRSARRDGYR